jgi:hypothetical protein
MSMFINISKKKKKFIHGGLIPQKKFLCGSFIYKISSHVVVSSKR